MCTCCNTCKNIQNSGINLTGIGLSGNRIALPESHLLCDHRIDLVDGFLISVKKLQKACLCSCCSLGTKKLKASKDILQILKIHHEFLCPQSSTFTNSCRLCRLEMGKCQRRLILIFICKLRKLCDHIDQLLLNQSESFCHYDNVCIISYITGGCAQMNDSLCFRTLYSICIHMGHNVMANLTFSLLGHIVIDVILVSLKFINLLLGDVQTKFFFCFCQSDPQSSPCTEFHIRRKNILHFLAGIAL